MSSKSPTPKPTSLTNLSTTRPLPLTVKVSSTLPPKKENPANAIFYLKDEDHESPSDQDLSERGWYSNPLYTDIELQQIEEDKDNGVEYKGKTKKHILQITRVKEINETCDGGKIGKLHKLGFSFQGGFVPQKTTLTVTYKSYSDDSISISKSGEIVDFDDTNDKQVIDVSKLPEFNTEEEDLVFSELTLNFFGSTDFYARVIVYEVEVWVENN